jgi:anti-sigma factor RsiW
MSCLKISDIYAYLEGDLAPEQRGQVEEHLSGCPRCRSAVEERRFLGEAFSSLTPLPMPADFTERVMATVAPSGRLLPAWLTILLSGSAVASLLFVLFLGSGKNLLSLLKSINNSLWGYAKSAAVFAAKTAALISTLGRALRQVAGTFVNTLFELASAVGPAAQAVILVAGCVLLAALAYLLSKKFHPGERT